MNRKQMTTLGLLGVSATIVGAAILDQVRRPTAQRTWQGNLGGIPYDFRFPTPKRIQEKVWNKHTSHVVMPHVFGIGWSLNFYPLFHPSMQS